MGTKVQLFCMKDDPNSDSVEALLQEMKVEHDVIDVKANEDKVNDLVAKTGQWSVPALIIGVDLDNDGKPDTVIIGNEPTMIRNAFTKQ